MKALARRTTADLHRPHGPLADVMAGADVFIGVSGGTVPEEVVATMAADSIVFGAGQPDARGAPRRRAPARPGRGHRPLGLPEPDQQRARVPRASSAARSTSAPPRITEGMKLAAADALAGLVGDDLAETYVVPSPFDPRVAPAVAAAVLTPPAATASPAAERTHPGPARRPLA